jgi:hypothetical protein
VATFLYRLGKASYQNAGRVLALWVVAMVALLGVGVGFGGQTDEDFRIPGSESQTAFNRLNAVFPTFAGASAQAVLVAPEGDRLDTAENTALIEEMTRTLARSSGVDDAVSPFDEFAGRALSDDGRYGFIQIRFAISQTEVTDAMLDELLETREILEGSELIVEFGGGIFQDQTPGLTIAELFGVIFAGMVLIITFRSFRPAWMPLATADDETASVLTSPVTFTNQDRSGDVSLQETFSSVLAPVGLWLVALLYFLVLPSYSSRVLGSSAKTSTLLSRALGPILGVVLAWTAIVTLIIHALGSVAWGSVWITAPLVALTALTFATLHFAVWAWNPRWLAPLSLGAFVIQIVSLGNVIPLEILPSFYQAISGLTPLGWSIEALIAGFAGAEGSRLWAPIAALAVIAAISTVLSALSLESRRSAGIRSEVMLPASYPTR